MSKVILLGLVLLTTACSQHTGQNIIKNANALRAIQSMTVAGVNEEVTNCVKDIFDPGNRGGC